MFSSVSFLFSQAQLVEENTRMQSSCKIWFQQRAGRITASRFRDILHTDFSQPSLSLIKGICYPAADQFSSVPCQYGLTNEDTTHSAYFERFAEIHESLMIIKSGLILHPSYPFMGATPDGIIHCSCCGSGILEIKCPYSCRERSFKEVAKENDPDFCLEHGLLSLKKEHSYYYQVLQLQMQLCLVNYCDFVVWREDEIFHQRIFLDEDFIDDTFHKAKTFVKLAILLELVGKWFSRQNTMPTIPLQDSESASSSQDSTDRQLSRQGWCYCGKDETFDNMIGCDNKDFKIEWYHLACLKLDKEKIPKGRWYCPDCHKGASKCKI